MYRITVAWEDETGTKNLDGMLEDRSPSGAGVFITKAIPAGSRVTIKEKHQTRTGTVRYCRRDEGGYFIGIKYDELTMEATS
jgi:PilZ domain